VFEEQPEPVIAPRKPKPAAVKAPPAKRQKSLPVVPTFPEEGGEMAALGSQTPPTTAKVTIFCAAV
jgi:hypothetical protein